MRGDVRGALMRAKVFHAILDHYFAERSQFEPSIGFCRTKPIWAQHRILQNDARSHVDSATPTVTSGGTSASITMSCHYTSTRFHIASGTGATVEITDPPVAAATIAGGTVLEINMPDSGNVTFGGSSGTLVLDQPSTLTGAVKGFGAQDSIDLVTIGFGATRRWATPRMPVKLEVRPPLPFVVKYSEVGR